MRKSLLAAMGLAALIGMACSAVRTSTPAPVGQPVAAPSPTPPPIPTPIPPTAGPTKTPAVFPDATLPAGETAAVVFGTIREGAISLYFLSADRYFAARLDLGDEVPHAAWPAVSPDGERLAFVSVQASPAMRSKGIYIADLNGANPQPITFGDGTHPRWSPDGTQIAYTCNDGNDVCLINADGSGGTNLTVDSPAVDQHPSWTPDGRLVFMSNRDLPIGRLSEIYIMNADGTGVAPLTRSGDAYNAMPAVSPDGSRIAFESDGEVEIGSEIYVMDIDGQNVHRLTVDGVWNQNPTWSPDGQQILYAASDTDGNLDLYTVSVEGGEPTRLTENPSEDGGLRLGHAWLPVPLPVPGFRREAEAPRQVDPPPGSAPVTNAILFATSDFNCADCLESGIYHVAFDGANLVRLPLEGFFPAWDPDFRRIAYTLNGELYVANTDGSQPTPITHAFQGLGAVEWDDRGLNVVADCTPYGQFDVCLVDMSRGTIRNVTQPITFDTGLPLPAWLDDRIVVGTQIINQEGEVVGSLPLAGRVSSDGTRLAAIVDGQVTLIALDGSGAVAITEGDDAKGFPAWSPAGDMLVYTSAPGDGRLYLHAVRADGTGAYRLVDQPIAFGPTDPANEILSYYGYSWAP